MAGIGGVPLFALGTMASGMPKKPTAPTALTATANPDTSNRKRVSLSWTAPVNTGFPPVTSYNLEIVGVTTITGITGTSTTWSSGTVNTNYEFRVYAVNSAGVGLVSNTASATVTDVADTPTSLSINNTTTFGQLTASWSAPAYTGSAAITSYVLNVAGVGNVYSGGSTSYTWTGGTKGQSYTFTVYAVTSVGNGVTSGGVSSTVQGNVATGGNSVADVANFSGTGQTWRVHRFTGSGTFSVSVANQSFQAVMVGGGGMGGKGQDSRGGGGGGAGEVIHLSPLSLSATSYSVTVGGTDAASSIGGVGTARKGQPGGVGVWANAGGASGSGQPGGARSDDTWRGGSGGGQGGPGPSGDVNWGNTYGGAGITIPIINEYGAEGGGGAGNNGWGLTGRGYGGGGRGNFGTEPGYGPGSAGIVVFAYRLV